MKRDAGMRLDPELAAIVVLLPAFDLTDVHDARRLADSLIDHGRKPLPGVTVTDSRVRGRDGGEIPVRVYRPSRSGRLPVVMYIHGGAFILGGLETEDDRCEFYAREAECVVVTVDYRLSPEHPYPAAYHDCLDVLLWISGQADALKVDARRIAIGGESAGGALAAAIALDSGDAGVPSLVHQLLINPVLDHRSDSPSMRAFTDTPAWNRERNLLMWNYYLGDRADVDYRASPALAADLSGAPAASLWIAEYDPLRDENYEYAGRLMAQGVPVGLYQYPGTIHGFDGYRMTRIGRRALEDQVSALRRAFRD